MNVTRQEWTQIAEDLREQRRRIAASSNLWREEQLDAVDGIARVLANSFASKSSRFDTRRFLEIVGVPTG